MKPFLVLVLAASAAFSLFGQSKKIVAFALTPDEVRELQAVLPDVSVVLAQGRGVEQVADADAILGIISPELLRAAKKLKWVQSYSAGVETFLFPEFVQSSVTLTNCKIIQGPNIADHAFALLLALTRDLNRIIPGRARGKWDRREFHPLELRGKTAVVIGMGGIGSQIAQRARAFDMNVIGVDPKDIPLNPNVTQMVYPDRLDEVLPKADVVFVSAPHTHESEGMIGSKQFEEMKRGAYFIAVSRGKLYDTGALVKALDSRHLAGAGLDVTNPEPLPKEHPLWGFENVIVTPHIAGQSDQVQSRRIDLIKQNIARFSRGAPLLNVVDKVKGY